MKILAVDDDLFILELLPMMAARVGFTDVSTASSGAAALDMMNKGDVVFDCLLFDISMPGMNGIELCGLVRAIPAYKKTPIIMLTAMTDRDYIDRAFMAGATDYATKPFDIVELDSRLRAAEALVVAGTRAVASHHTKTGAPQSHNMQSQLTGLSEEMQIEGNEKLIRCEALKNYLAQLSRAGLASSQVVAIKIDQIETIYAKASPDEFLYALTEVADTIGDTFKVYGYMMAHAGNGFFLVVSSKASMESSVSLEDEIQSLLDERGTEYDNGDPLDIEITIGNPIRPSLSKTQQARKTFDRAIARAESRALRKRTEPRRPNIRLVRKY